MPEFNKCPYYKESKPNQLPEGGLCTRSGLQAVIHRLNFRDLPLKKVMENCPIIGVFPQGDILSCNAVATNVVNLASNKLSPSLLTK